MKTGEPKSGSRDNELKFYAMVKHQRRAILVTLLLLCGAAVQGYPLIRQAVAKLEVARGMVSKSGLWRSAALSHGEKFAGFIEFLNSQIPSEARVVLPGAEVKQEVLGNTPTMQYFLAPRQVINCPGEDCVPGLDPAGTYILVVESFPGKEAPEGFGIRQMYNERWGFLPPIEPAAGQSTPLVEFDSYKEIAQAALAPLTWLLVLTASGALFVSSMLPLLGLSLVLSMGFAGGLAAFSLSTALLSLLGVDLSRPLLLGISAVQLAAAAAFFMGVRWRRDKAASTSPFRVDAWPLAIAALGALAGLLSVAQGYSVSDELLLWGPKASGIAAAGSIRAVVLWGTNTVDYPLHLPVLLAAFKTLFGETLPASKLLPAGYFTAWMLLLYASLKHAGVRSTWAGLAALLAGSAPVVFRHAALQYANLPFAFYLACGAACLALAFKETAPGNISRSALLGSLFLAASAWTRPEGLVFAGLVLLITLGSWRRRSGEQHLPWAALLLPFVLYAAFWAILRNLIYTQPNSSSGLAQEAIAALLSGDWHANDLVYLLGEYASHLVSPAAWGLLGALVLLTWLLALKGSWSALPERLLAGSSFVIALAVLGMYYLVSFDSKHDLSWWVSTGLERMLLPVILLSGLGWAGWLKLLDHGKERPLPAHLEHQRGTGE